MCASGQAFTRMNEDANSVISTEARIFSGLSHPAIEAIMERAVRASVRPYTPLCHAGQEAIWFYLILKGQVKYCRPAENGVEILIHVLSKNECFGLGTFQGAPIPYLGTAETMTFCEILKWRHADIVHLTQRFPLLGQNALAIVLRYLAEYSSRHASLVAESGTTRLARVLIDLANRIGTPSPEGVDVPITNEDLGALADVSRFTVSRTMSRWRNRKLIKKNRNHVVLMAPDGLVSPPHISAN